MNDMRWHLRRLARRAALCVAIVLLLAGCSSQNPTGSVEKKPSVLTIPLALKSTIVDEYRLTIDAFDINPPIVIPMNLVAGILQAEVTVPAGFLRTFTLEALVDGVVIYSGQKIVTVLDGVPLELDIRLWPQVPLINLTPRYQRLPMGESFTLAVNIYNLPQVANLACTISVQTAPVDLDSLSLGPEIASSAQMSQTQIFGSWLKRRVVLSSGTADTPLFADPGYYHLLDAKFQSFDFWDEQFAFVNVEVLLESIVDVTGRQFNLETIYVDQAELVLYSTSSAGQTHRNMSHR